MATARHHSPKLGRSLGAALAARALLLVALLMMSPAARSAAPARPSFDHTTTGFELLGRHRDLPCESCHANAVFKGTPKVCNACHGVGTVIRATAKPTNHILSTDTCGACHSEIAWSPAVTFDHTQSRGSCSTCHNGVQAQGKPPTHIVTDLECDACHTTLTWAGAVFTHQGVTGNCAECHNGAAATGMPANHIPVGTTACEGCHSPTNFVTFAGTKINHLAVTALTCASCHQTAAYLGMHPSTNTTAADSRPNATLDKNHPATGDCGQCHDTTTFANSALRPANHIPTNAPCAQCHTTAGNYALYSVTGVHQGVTGCLTCHGPTVGPFANVTMVTTPGNHIPIGSLDCSGSGCHTTKNVNAGGFKIGAASISAPTLSVAGHSTVAAAVAACQSCHESASFLGMLASTPSSAGDSRPTALDKAHPTSGDCNGCHTTTPTFAVNVTQGAKPANHIPTTAACAQCHTTSGNYALYSVTGTHQGVTACLTCHGPTVGPFANVTMVTTPANHFPIGSLDCNGSGCHTAANVNPGGFKLGTASINAPTLNAAGHTTIASVIGACATCHETAPYVGMLASTGTAAADSRPTAFDAKHPGTGDCGNCHVTTPVFATNLLPTATKPANHIPTTAVCAQCHTTAGNFAVYSVTGVHQGITGCLTCHGPTVANTFINVKIVTTPANHIPIGSLDCSGSGCHTTKNVNAGGFKLGTASINAPTLTVAGHSTVAAAVAACQSCHESASYLGMLASTATTAGDSRPTAFDKAHPTSGDCNGCHTTTPTFAGNATQGAKPANHIPTNAPCVQCHTTSGNYALYSVTGTHQGVTGCLTCHAPSVAGTFANIKIVSSPSNHIPIGSLDCNGSGCHTVTNVNPGGFKLGTASINAPTLNAAGHTTISSVIGACATCHETAPYTGMLASTATAAADSRPTAFDAKHPGTGDCGNCHVTTPVFATNLLPTATKPANHIPTTAVCAQCHTTAGNFAVYSVTGVHQGVTGCLTCHGPKVGPFLNVTMVTTPANHFPIGSLDCSGSGCHTTKNVNAGGFKLGTASINSPTLTAAGHSTVAAAVAACQSCHESAPYVGMLASTATTAGDSRPTALDKAHPTSGDCNGCHTTTPTFAGNVTQSGKPANHIPTTAACTQCHTTAGNYALYSVTGTHQGVTACLTCHAPSVAGTFANIKIVSSPSNHIPIGSLDCNGSGCHTVTNVNAGGFKLGTASINSPTLTVAGHSTVAAAVAACQSCHESAPYVGMLASTATAAGDSRPTALDKAHPTSGDCNGCHTTTPTFAGNVTQSGKPANHIPTTAACAQCHTTSGNYALYSVTGTHQGVTACLTCHAPSVAGTFANIKIATTPSNHFPIGSLDCNGSGCHTVTNVNPGGFKLGTASINAPTLNAAGHTTISSVVGACATCHETAPYVGMLASTGTAAADSRPTAFDAKHPATGDCGNCHVTTPVFATNLLPTATKPANHIPTTAVCAQCHTTAGNFAVYSVTGVHQGVTGCLTCHGPKVGPFLNVTMVTTPANHFPIGSLDCSGSGCHTTKNVNAGGFKLGTASINSPTLTVAGHTTVAAAVSGCQSCHESAPYVGMLVSTATAAGDSRPTALDKAHPTSGDCNGCHTTTPTFANNQTGNAKPANHIPTTAACAQCHTTAGNYALYSVTGTHQGVTACLTCHAPSVAGTFANIKIVSSPSNHMPIGSLDCNGSGCHTISNVNAGGFKLGNASISAPTLTVAGHTTVAKAVSGCQTCHESAPYVGMLASTATAAGDSRPTAFDKAHPTSGDCNGCHTTTPTFATNQSGSAKPANHIPTTAACTQCHTTAGNYALYSVTGTHQGVTACLTCHGPSVAGTFANIKIVTTPSNHFPIGTLDCNGSGCHTITNVNTGGFKLGTANINAPTLTVAGHTTVAKAVSGCQTCHETAPYAGMLASTATAAGDSRPTAFDKAHPTSGDCNGCHTTTPTFTSNVTAATKPANHIPTNAACTQCHTTAGNYALYVMGATGHKGITSNCAQCHAYGLSFYNMAPPTLVQPPSGATGHIPAVPPNGTATIACELCHSPATFTAFSGTVMKHAYVTSMKCMSCHELGMKWKTNTGQRLWVRPSAGHHAGQDCNGSGCHSSRDKLALRPVRPTATTAGTAGTTNGPLAHTAPGRTLHAPSDGTASDTPLPAGPFVHASVLGTACVSCHSPASGAGKPANHLTTTDSCQACHSTLAWLPVTRVDHSQVRGTCVSCHNGLTAPGKPAKHLPTTAACDSCHTTNAWTPARFDHAAVAPRTCVSCHNAVRAIGLPRAHIPTTQSCDACHGTLGWKPAKVDHSAIVSGCAACHNNAGAVGIPAGHLRMSRDCSSCHSYPEWSAVRFRHASAAYPGNHRVALACSSCHTSETEAVPYPSPANAGTCAGCHAKDFKPTKHPKVLKGADYTVSELANCSGACHVYTDASGTKVGKSQPGPYHRVTDATFKH